ncbi:hypothetical protein [Proteiniborus sp. DW1]|uniref:hypothetical protein n=1 Tax=Proteiniborus sp. DW1 TaxID=1889883 RepID=UPI0013566283|nr:hypothetical protein [Proteiniborus sp. DW1]
MRNSTTRNSKKKRLYGKTWSRVVRLCQNRRQVFYWKSYLWKLWSTFGRKTWNSADEGF